MVEDEISQISAKSVRFVTKFSTFLLLTAVVLYALWISFTVMLDPISGNPSVYFLGTLSLGSKNLIYIEGLGAIFGFLSALLSVLFRLFAGLSFAAVCFDEEKNIWFRIVSVAALMLIMFGGLNIM